MKFYGASSRDILIEIVRDSLREVIEPALPDGRAKLMAQAAFDLLGDALNTEAESNPSYWPQAIAELPETLKLVTANSDVDATEQAQTLLTRLLGRRNLELRDSAEDEWLRTVVALQEQAIEEAPSLASGYALSATARIPGYKAPEELSTRLEVFFAARRDLTDNASSVNVELLGGGSSKSSFLVTCNGAGEGGGGVRQLVVRRDGPYLPLDSSVVDEFPLFKFLEPFGLPVPRALHVETDPAVCGTAFIVFEKSEGQAGPEGWGSPEHVRSTAIELAEFLAKLHALPVEHLVENPPEWLNPLHLCRSVEGMVAFWHRIRFRPEPLMDAVLAWLLANKPDARGPQVLVHGDAAFHNVLARDGHIGGVLDWEVAHLGQVEEDLGYLHPFVSAVMPWEDFLQAYRDAGGREVVIDNQRYYAVMAFARITLSIHNGLDAVNRNKAGLDTKDAWIASRYADRFLIETFKRIVQ